MGYGMQVYDFEDLGITKRKILVSVSIIAVMITIGLFIAGKISDHQLDRNAKYNKAVKIESQEMFQYGMDTDVGDAFVYGDLEAVDTVTYPEIGGEYLYVEKVKIVSTIMALLPRIVLVRLYSFKRGCDRVY